MNLKIPARSCNWETQTFRWGIMLKHVPQNCIHDLTKLNAAQYRIEVQPSFFDVDDNMVLLYRREEVGKKT